jgi:hypothetical protein
LAAENAVLRLQLAEVQGQLHEAQLAQHTQVRLCL